MSVKHAGNLIIASCRMLWRYGGDFVERALYNLMQLYRWFDAWPVANVGRPERWKRIVRSFCTYLPVTYLI